MVKRDLMGLEIWECSREEARRVWVEMPDERWRIWSVAEVEAAMLFNPDQLQEVINKKKANPKEYLEIKTPERGMVELEPHYCPTIECLCSARLPKSLDPTICQHCEPAT